jgi:pyruvate/2-oxoglutarate dehydrogenase complex dihydrolipoamide dehydrogenase (E3) component
VNGEQTTAKNIYAIGDVLHNPKVGTAALRCAALRCAALRCAALRCFALAAAATTARSALEYSACTASVLE